MVVTRHPEIYNKTTNTEKEKKLPSGTENDKKFCLPNALSLQLCSQMWDPLGLSGNWACEIWLVWAEMCCVWRIHIGFKDSVLKT